MTKNIVNLKDKRLAKELDDIDLEIQKINDLLNTLLTNVTMMLEQYGFEERDENFSKNFYYVAEALRSLVLSHFKINHPFQEIVEKSVARRVGCRKKQLESKVGRVIS